MGSQRFPYLDMLEDAPEYFYFCRSWWDGIGIDAAMWWRDHNKRCHYWCLVTGESHTISQRQELARRMIAPAEFDSLCASAIQLGILQLKTQQQEIILTHYDDMLGMKSPDGSIHSYFVRCGKHRDARDAQIRELIWRHAPELRQFYEKGSML